MTDQIIKRLLLDTGLLLQLFSYAVKFCPFKELLKLLVLVYSFNKSVH